MERKEMRPAGDSGPAPQHWEDSRVRLLDERRQVIGAIAVNTPGDASSVEKVQESDYASLDQIRDVDYKRREALSRRLRDLDDALERINSGVYGLCAQCGARIAAKRLAGDPAVSFCVGCQAASESPTSPLTL